jgi:hypothetical protein
VNADVALCRQRITCPQGAEKLPGGRADLKFEV